MKRAMTKRSPRPWKAAQGSTLGPQHYHHETITDRLMMMETIIATSRSANMREVGIARRGVRLASTSDDDAPVWSASGRDRVQKDW